MILLLKTEFCFYQCRYFAIKYPLRRTSFFGSYSNLILIIIWIFGIAISLPQFVASRIETFKYGDNTYLDCREDWDDKHNEKVGNSVK
jgi:hypothetical protein